MKIIFWLYAIQSISLRDENPRSCDILRKVDFQRMLYKIAESHWIQLEKTFKEWI